MGCRVRTFSYDPLPYQPVMSAMLAEIVGTQGSNDFIISSVGDGTDERVTYAEAGARSAEMAGRLIAAGVGKGTRVGILAPNGPDFAVAFLAVTRIGAVAVPINTFFQPPELAWLLRDADIHTLVSVDTLLGKDIRQRVADAVGGPFEWGRPFFHERLPLLRNVFSFAGSEWPTPVSQSVLQACEATVRPADDLVVIYTSGSTSDPKGIIHTHATAITH